MRMELHVFLNVLLVLNYFYISNGSWNTPSAICQQSKIIVVFVVIHCFLFYDEKNRVSLIHSEKLLSIDSVFIRRNNVSEHRRTMHNLYTTHICSLNSINCFAFYIFIMNDTICVIPYLYLENIRYIIIFGNSIKLNFNMHVYKRFTKYIYHREISTLITNFRKHICLIYKYLLFYPEFV